MTTEPTAARTAFGDAAPVLAEITDKVLFGDVWLRPGLSPRDRSLVTVASLVALYRTNELPFHIKRAIENGVNRDEIVELITHLRILFGLADSDDGADDRTPHIRRDRSLIVALRPIGSRPFNRGPEEFFSGTVFVEMLFDGPPPSNVSGGSVTFTPGARSAWHTHPLGQTLIVTSGCGWHQIEGGPIEAIHPGDVIQCPADTRHWHGATSTTAMTHIAITEKLDGKNVHWMEKVSDEDYAEGPQP